MVKPVDRLLAGYRGYRAIYHEKREEATRRLAEGQNPRIMMIACSDSRVDPAILFNAEPGEIFVVRNVAALVPPYEPDDRFHGTSAAIEFAVLDLKVEHVIILGHHKCGGIAALRQIAQGKGATDREFMGPWVEIAREACEKYDLDDPSAEALVERAAVGTSMQNLKSFPFIRERATDGSLSLHGWWFDITSGNLMALDHETGEFGLAERIEAKREAAV